MLNRMFRMFICAAMAAALLCSLSACGSGSAARLDRLEERDPYLKRAMARKNAQDIDGAIDLYEKALERKPTLARAHLDLGLLYEKYRQDYIRAIYHYQRYLELRPTAEKKKLVEDLIRQARMSFAASLPDQPSEAVRQISLLKKEIESLRAQIGHPPKGQPVQAEKPDAPASVAAASAASVQAPPVPSPKPAQPAVQTYVVQSGDTLSSISTRMYRDPTKWKVIYDANRNVLVSPQSVKVGQTLMIPVQ
ncbi:MAG: LysM peptidoglycan-binding domain-containing protein [Lentisphaerota bacterium]